ncbi:hypothetical protein TrLO_g3197 [Triparma laevis f. longispina]|uniref:Uncharacterized protein n=1 Tax=Triparma laevis f. longispina TaxID=1714387 RepID=A0A9W7KRL4_9STRA|nr:hypothetical protein TrLO_g3197 [Triparma laevis f. longispina]
MTTVSAAAAATDHFIHTPEFKRHFVDFVHVQTLMKLRLATKGWNTAADALIDEGVESGDLIVHGGKDISLEVAWGRFERHKIVKRAILLLNITKVGDYAWWKALNLVVVDILEGVESIGETAFLLCRSLTTVSFPTTLTLIGEYPFALCSSLDNVDLLHTNLQELGDRFA